MCPPDAAVRAHAVLLQVHPRSNRSSPLLPPHPLPAALHPGYGFLSESADLSERCAAYEAAFACRLDSQVLLAHIRMGSLPPGRFRYVSAPLFLPPPLPPLPPRSGKGPVQDAIESLELLYAQMGDRIAALKALT